ncbi:uncharacterized protein LOC132936079 [Metopolophium dirhodum]|uniref:uncharacterized protein LOC132936079 n=1 Tax=Metopolophium dirhodum TaxID=44670 RepID=UPI00298F8E7B|nr:uncharacterized protein LOC132936079 [Metopolophium dirhodum]
MDLKDEIADLSSLSSSMIQKFSFLTTTIPFESSPAFVLSNLSVNNFLVTSIKTYMLPIHSPSLGYIAQLESWSLQTDENLLTSTFNNDIDIYTNIESLTIIDDFATNWFYCSNPIMPTKYCDCNVMRLTKNISTKFSKSVCVEDREMLEEQNVLRFLQLFQQEPTLPDIYILHNIQV